MSSEQESASGAAPEVCELPREDEAHQDGILEEDNPIPSWFNITFIGTVIFGVLYMIFYTTSGWSARGQWQDEVAAAAVHAEAAKVALPATNPFAGDPEAIASGKEVFATVCAACHKPDGHGLVGPSLVDPFWKYGNTDAELYASVAEGRPGGMPAWGTQLGSEKIWQALAYMATLPTTEEPGVGAPGQAVTAGGR